MITFEEACKIARELKPNMDKCTEYENAYVFGCHDDDHYVGGYGHTPCVILKADGKTIPMPEFVIQESGKEIKSFDL